MKQIPLLLFLLSTLAFAHEKSGRETGNGGIVILLADGKTKTPIDLYEGEKPKLMTGICHLPDYVDGLMEKKVWQKELNTFIHTIALKSLGFANLIKKSFLTPYWYALTLDPGERIADTNDDGSVIDGRKSNGAIRIADEIYLDTDVMLNFWVNKNKDYPYQKLIGSILHEALLGVYKHSKRSKRPLGKVVVETLRLAGHFSQENSRPDHWLKDKKGRSFSEFLSEHGVTLSDYKLSFPKLRTIYTEKKLEKVHKSRLDFSGGYAKVKPWKELVSKSKNWEKFYKERKLFKKAKRNLFYREWSLDWDYTKMPRKIPALKVMTTDQGILESIDTFTLLKNTAVYTHAQEEYVLGGVTYLETIIFKHPVTVNMWDNLKNKLSAPSLRLCD